MDECYKCMENVTEILIKYNKPKKSQIDLVYKFTVILSDKSISISRFYEIILDFVKKLEIKKKYNETSIKNKINDNEINILIENEDNNKLIDFIFTE